MENEVVYIKLDDIIPNRFQPREVFDEKALNELADSIRQHGVIQPIIVRQVGNKYEIIAGERRYKASAIAGLTTIPVIVKNLNDKDSSIVAFIENSQRKDVSPIEEARTSDRILKSNNMTQQELAIELGISQSALANKLRLLSLPLEVQDALMRNEISERHARSLLSVNDKEKQIELLNKIIVNKMTVRDLENEIRNSSTNTNGESVNMMNQQVNNINNNTDNNENIGGMFIPNIGFVPGYKPGEPINPNENISNNTVENTDNYTKPINLNPNNNLVNPFDNITNNYNNSNNINENNSVNNNFNNYQNNNLNNNNGFDLSQYENNSNNSSYDDNDMTYENTNIVKDDLPTETFNVNIDNGYIVENNNIGIQSVDDVIDELKHVLSKCKNAKIKIDTEEVDFDDMYQITIKVNKNENF